MGQRRRSSQSPAEGRRKPQPNPRSPSRVQGRSPRRGSRGSPPALKNVGGWSGRDSGAGQTRPSAEGGRKPQQDHPSSRRILSLPPHSAEGNKATPPFPKQGAGAQPPPVVQRVPLFPKTSEGGPGGTTASATKSPLPFLPRPGRKVRKRRLPSPIPAGTLAWDDAQQPLGRIPGAQGRHNHVRP